MTFALICAAAIQGQVHYARYEDARAAAIASSTPLVVYQDCRPGEPFTKSLSVAASLEDYAGYSGLIVSVPKDGKLLYAGKLPAGASQADVDAVVARAGKVVQLVAAPFEEVGPDLYGRAKWYSRLAALETVDDKSLQGIGLVPYDSARLTQQTFSRQGFRNRDGSLQSTENDLISIVSRYHPSLPSKWHQPGGMQGIRGAYSNVYKHVTGVKEGKVALRPWEKFGPITYQRTYADGTLFVDMLSTDKGYFEGRAAEKVDGQWIRYVFHRDKTVRPAGYVGLRGQSCVSCHGTINQEGPGSGEYAGPEAPGGDTIVSDKMQFER